MSVVVDTAVPDVLIQSWLTDNNFHSVTFKTTSPSDVAFELDGRDPEKFVELFNSRFSHIYGKAVFRG